MPKPKKKATEQDNERKVLYPTLESAICCGDNAITVEQAKQFMGWEEEQPTTDSGKGTKFGNDFLLTDNNGKKIRCVNNDHNRPFNLTWAQTLAQDILNRHFAPAGPNGEAIIIGKTGRVQSGQHRLIGLILASQIWAGKQSVRWEHFWDKEPTIDSFVSLGVDESSVTTRTLDNVRPRTFSDVLYTDREIFGKFAHKDRVVLCRMIDYSVKMLWSRTGAKEDAFTPHRTHSEGLEFLERHKRLKKAVAHIFEEDKDNGSIHRYLSLGYAAALCYMMGCAKSDGDEYRIMNSPNESKLDWELWDNAQEFWVLVANAKPDKGSAFRALDQTIKGLRNPETGTEGSVDEKLAVFIKAWGMFSQGQDLKEGDLELNYLTDQDTGDKSLNDYPNLGGIDLGNSKAQEDAEEETPAVQPSEDQKQAAQDARAKRIEEVKAKLAEAREAKLRERSMTSKDVREENRRKAIEADAALAAERANGALSSSKKGKGTTNEEAIRAGTRG